MLYQTILLAIDPSDERSHRLLVKAGIIAEQNNAEFTRCLCGAWNRQ